MHPRLAGTDVEKVGHHLRILEIGPPADHLIVRPRLLNALQNKTAVDDT